MSIPVIKTNAQAIADTERYPVGGKFHFINGLREGLSEEDAGRYAAKVLCIKYWGDAANPRGRP